MKIEAASSLARCAAPLFLILCGACEAVNDPGALRCHGCGAALGTEASDKPAVAPPASLTSLARTEASDKPASRLQRGESTVRAWL